MFQLGAPSRHFLMDRARRVGVLAAVEAAVQHGVAQGCHAQAPVRLAQQPLAARTAFRGGEHRCAVDQQLVVEAPFDEVLPAREGAGGGQGAVGGGRDAQRGVVRVVPRALLAEEEVPMALAQRQFPTGSLDGVRPERGPEPPRPDGPGGGEGEDGLLAVPTVPGHQLDGPFRVVGEGALQEETSVLRPGRQVDGGLYGAVADQQIAAGACGQTEFAPLVAVPAQRVAARQYGSRHIDRCPAPVRADELQAVRKLCGRRPLPRPLPGVGEGAERDIGCEAPPPRHRGHGPLVHGHRTVEGGTRVPVDECEAQRSLAETVADHPVDHHGACATARAARAVCLEAGIDPLGVQDEPAALEGGHDPVVAVGPVHGRRCGRLARREVGAAQHAVPGDADLQAPGEPF